MAAKLRRPGARPRCARGIAAAARRCARASPSAMSRPQAAAHRHANNLRKYIAKASVACQERDGYLAELEELLPQLEAALAGRAAAEAAAAAAAAGGAALEAAQAAARVRPNAQRRPAHVCDRQRRHACGRAGCRAAPCRSGDGFIVRDSLLVWAACKAPAGVLSLANVHPLHSLLQRAYGRAQVASLRGTAQDAAAEASAEAQRRAAAERAAAAAQEAAEAAREDLARARAEAQQEQWRRCARAAGRLCATA